MKKFQGRGLIQITGRQTGKSQMVAYQRMFKDIWESDVKVSNIVLAEGKVYGARYYTAEPVGGNWLEMEQWCIKMFGDQGNVWENLMPEPGQRWYMNNRRFWFRKERDRTMFILRWS